MCVGDVLKKSDTLTRINAKVHRTRVLFLSDLSYFEIKLPKPFFTKKLQKDIKCTKCLNDK